MSTLDPENNHDTDDDQNSLLKKLVNIIKGQFNPKELEDREDIQEILTAAHQKHIIDEESYTMILGSMSFAEKVADDIMVPRSKMNMVDIATPLEELVPFIIDTAHSRFPVYEEDRDNVIGLLLAKDLLRAINNPQLDVRKLLRPAFYVPESKRLNQLLKEFKTTRNHIALVIDEYGSLTGLVTMEDILELIVGDIEDEYDEEHEQTIFPESETAWRIMGGTYIEDFNKTINASIPEDENDTIGGWLTEELDHIPKRGDIHSFDDLKFQVLRADERRALWIHVRRTQSSPIQTETHDKNT